MSVNVIDDVREKKICEKNEMWVKIVLAKILIIIGTESTVGNNKIKF